MHPTTTKVRSRLTDWPTGWKFLIKIALALKWKLNDVMKMFKCYITSSRKSGFILLKKNYARNLIKKIKAVKKLPSIVIDDYWW